MRADSPRARRATRLAFWACGFGVAAWAPLVPFARQRLGVDEGTLGLLLLSMGIGSVVAMLQAGRLCARQGCRAVALGGQLGMALLLPTLALAPTPLALGLALFAFGAALGALDVAMNVQAVEVERDAGQPLLSGFHGLFSVGGAMGAAAMAAMLSLGLSPLLGTLVASVLLLGVAAATAPGLMGRRPEPPQGALVLPRGPVLALAALAAVSFLVEGALLDWGALLLTALGRTEAAQAGLGYAAFALAMTAGRLGGDAVTARFGDTVVLGAGGALALAGFALVLLAPWLAGSLVGFALIGLGAANVVPVLFRRAGRQLAMPTAQAVATLTFAGYGGYLLGPALVGFAANGASLPAAFWGLAVLFASVPLSAVRITRPTVAAA